MNDTICSVATSLGVGAISIIRVSGLEAISIVNKIFKGKNLEKVKSHTVHYGHIIDNLEIVDEVLVSIMKAPKTYTVEDVVETSYNVYPNPVKDVLTVTGENMRQVEIYNSLGQLVKSISCNDDEVKINVNDMQNGMYFVNVIDNNGEMTTSKVSVLR